MLTISSANAAPARLTSDSSASDSKPTELVSHHAPNFSAIVASATATDSLRYELTRMPALCLRDRQPPAVPRDRISVRLNRASPGTTIRGPSVKETCDGTPERQ